MTARPHEAYVREWSHRIYVRTPCGAIEMPDIRGYCLEWLAASIQSRWSGVGGWKESAETRVAAGAVT